MKKLMVSLIAVILLCACITCAQGEQTEEITLTTYYPAPFGEYDGLAADSMAVGRTYAIPAADNLVVEGKVGIGTTTPTVKLDVAGNIQFNSTLQTPGRMHITGGEYLYLLNRNGVIIGKEWGGNGNLYVQGNVGIGINPQSNAKLWAYNSTSGGYGVYGSYTGNPFSICSGVRGDGQWIGVAGYAPSPWMSYYSGGVVGVGGAIGVKGIGSYADLYCGQSGTIRGAGRMHIYGGELLYLLNRNGVIIGKEWGGNGNLSVQGTIYWPGGHAPDYVFEPGYELDSIEESAMYMWKNKHLKAIPTVKKNKDDRQERDMGEYINGILEEVEKAHIYIQQLNERIKVLEALDNELEARIKSIEVKLK